MSDSTGSSRPKIGMVLYTDGGCGPTNPGFAGHGVHGYKFLNEKPKKGTGCANYIITFNGYVIDHDGNEVNYNDVTVLEYYDCTVSKPIGTNTTAEMNAMIEAFRLILENPDVATAVIWMDSETVRNGLEKWVAIWQRNNWKKSNGEDVKNKELWVEIDELRTTAELRGVQLAYNWVKGHGICLGNITADILATVGKRRSQDGIITAERTVSKPDGYWGRRGDLHPMIDKPYMFFITDNPHRVPGLYTMNTSGDLSKFPGKRTKNASYSVILTKPLRILEEFLDFQTELSSIPTLVAGDMSKLGNARVSAYLERYGKHVLSREDGRRINVAFGDKTRISEEVNPPGIADRELSCLSFLIEKLYMFKRVLEKGDFSPPSNLQRFHNITSVFYHTEKKKKGEDGLILNPDIKVPTKKLPVNIEVQTTVKESQHVELNLILGHDILERNALKRIETMNPVVYLYTWFEAPACMRYCVFITTNDGSIGVWCSMHSNMVLSSSFLNHDTPHISLIETHS